jgi:4-amino-4-deoxy-L-arabinose transferase-like glycosyltransferase
LRLPYALLSALFVVALFLLVRRLSDQRLASLAALLVAFDPFFLAHSRVAHGDGPVTVFMGVAALAFALHLQRAAAGPAANLRSARNNVVSGWLVLSAICGGLAALTKSPGQFVLPLVVLVGLVEWTIAAARGQRRTTLLYRLVDLAIWGAVAGVVFVCLWPALWIDPIGTLRRMLEETFGKVEAGHLVFFMGQPTLDPGVWFYPYVIAFRLTPVVWLGLLAAAGATVSAALAHRRSASANGTPRAADQSPTPIAAPRLIAVSAVFVVGLLVFGI